MEWWLILAVIVGALIIAMSTGLPVIFCFVLVTIGGIVFFQGEPGLRTLVVYMWTSLRSFSLLPILMFVLMGEIIFRSGAGFNVLNALQAWLGRLPGRLALLVVGASTLFSMMSGSSIGTTAMMGSMVLPDMEKQGYKKPMTIGPIMGSGGLAIIIPPSSTIVIWATVAEVSVGQLLIAGLIPGLILSCFYTAYVIGRCFFQPSVAPAYEVKPFPLSKKLRQTMRYVAPTGIVIFSVLGLIMIGLATPSEAAATGVIGTIILAALAGSLSWKMLKECFAGTVEIAAALLLIIAGSQGFGQILAYSGAARSLVEFAAALPVAPIVLMIGMQLLLLVMGMFMGAIPMIMITVPIFMPLIYELGLSPLWFGILFLINIEMGMTTPPYGLLLFVMRAVTPPHISTGDIIRAGLPFLVCDAALVSLLLACPAIAVWLPSVIF